MVSFGTQHRYPPLRQVRDSDVAQVELLTPGSGTPENVYYEENADAPWQVESESRQRLILIDRSGSNELLVRRGKTARDRTEQSAVGQVLFQIPDHNAG